MDDEDGEWGLAMGPGPSTMDALRDHFGEASFRDACPGSHGPQVWNPHRPLLGRTLE